MAPKTQRDRTTTDGRQPRVTVGRIETYFNVECPVCGRKLRVLVEYLGERVACGHCGRCFDALASSSTVPTAPSTLYRAEELLRRCSNGRSGQQTESP